jgi:peptidoglycan/LPS O-acetylase OafA/YrhL
MDKAITSAKKRIDYIDLLRVIAITAVICFHFLFSAISRGRTPNLTASPFFELARYGYLGVELFFMITGFVIVQSVRDLTFRKFLSKRFLRLYPLYWISLICIFAISTFGIWGRPGPLAETFYYNLTMFPNAFEEPWLDPAHWFMARQLQFYVAIAIVLLLRSGKHLVNIFIFWSLIGLIWDIFKIEQFNIWYFNGFFALIAGGAIIAAIRELGFTRFRVLGLIASYLWAVKSRMDLEHWLNVNRGPGHSALTIGLIVTAIYLLMMLTWSSTLSNWKIAGVTFAGTMSYPVYLIHDRLGGLAIARFGTDGNKYFVYLVVISCAVLLAYLVWRTETRIMSLFVRQRTSPNRK